MDWFSAVWDMMPLEVKGAFLALIMTFLRHYKSPKQNVFRYVLVEGLTCFILTLSISAALIIIAKVDPYISIAVGGILGYMGPAWIEAKINTKVDDFIDIKTDEDNS